MRFIKSESDCGDCSLLLNLTFEKEMLICPALHTDGCCNCHFEMHKLVEFSSVKFSP